MQHGNYTTGNMSEKKDMVRVVIVDDSAQYRKILSTLLNMHPRLTVIGEAVNGIEALGLILRSKPDVILMDFEMPLMDGMTALQHLMIHVPTPTIMFSRLTAEGTARCFDALKNGAVDFFSKDKLQDIFHQEGLQRQLIDKVLSAAEVSMEAVEPVFPPSPFKKERRRKVKSLVFCEECGSKEEAVLRENEDQGGVICSACGEYISLMERNKYRRANCLSIIVAGEGAYINLLKLVPHLRQDMNGAVLIVIDGNVEHVDAFTQYLDEISTINIVRIQDGLSIQGGNCYVGSDTENIYFKPFSADYSLKCKDTYTGSSSPVDQTIGSVAEVFRERAAVVFLSGNARQGDKGLKKVTENNGTIIVLDPVKCLKKEMSSDVYQRFTAVKVKDEDELAALIRKIHFHYRDTIVTA